jgi:hypothetical protein
MANTYSIENLLEGKYYRSSSFARKGKDGIIQYAEKRSDVWYGTDTEAYAVKVRPTWNGTGFPKPDFWATIVVKVGE